jgi:hypothetical protein
MTTQRRSVCVNHVAMSVPVATFTPEYRAGVLDFYGEHFGWTEIDELALHDRLTLAVGRRCYINVRARAEVMTCTGYEHVGVVFDSAESVEALWHELSGRVEDLTSVTRGDDGYRSLRFRHLLPLAVEVQYFPAAVEGSESWALGGQAVAAG